MICVTLFHFNVDLAGSSHLTLASFFASKISLSLVSLLATFFAPSLHLPISFSQSTLFLSLSFFFLASSLASRCLSENSCKSKSYTGSNEQQNMIMMDWIIRVNPKIAQAPPLLTSLKMLYCFTLSPTFLSIF